MWLKNQGIRMTHEYEFVLGLDECGRGALAGPISVGCALVQVGTDSYWWSRGAKDSKKLSYNKRVTFYRDFIYDTHPTPSAYHIAYQPSSAVDALGISKATQICVWDCLNRMIRQYGDQITTVFFDRGLKPRSAELHLPDHIQVIEADKDGESKWASVAIASILAKVERDCYMEKLGSQYPQYKFEDHKGYGSEVHRQAIKQHGVIQEIHRTTFCKNFL